MATTYTIRPSYGADIYIDEEGDIIIRQRNAPDDGIVILTPAEAEAAVEHINQLLIELRSSKTK